MIVKTYHVSGNETIGYRLIIPMKAYLKAGQPEKYICTIKRNGTLIYQPVHQ